jgi:hypothetical protein
MNDILKGVFFQIVNLYSRSVFFLEWAFFSSVCSCSATSVVRPIVQLLVYFFHLRADVLVGDIGFHRDAVWGVLLMCVLNIVHDLQKKSLIMSMLFHSASIFAINGSRIFPFLLFVVHFVNT